MVIFHGYVTNNQMVISSHIPRLPRTTSPTASPKSKSRDSAKGAMRKRIRASSRKQRNLTRGRGVPKLLKGQDG